MFCEQCFFELTGFCLICDEPYCEDCDGTCPNEDEHDDDDDSIGAEDES